MASNGNGKRNGWSYNNETLKNRIENNEHVKKIRQKLMEEKIRKVQNK
ncbi:MAG: hypothetical protein ACFFDF_01760 [Candidatus Odinarchaeota archaeon]